MTGFGLSKSVKGNSEISIEIKGVNHRFLEISIKPNDLGNELEKFISLSVEENYYKETEYSKKLTKLFPKYNNTVMCIDPIGSEW